MRTNVSRSLTTALLVAATVVVGGPAPAAEPTAEPADSRLAAEPAQSWYEGVRAGTTRFGSAPGARCRPRAATALAGRRCLLTYSGRFTATDRGYRGTYAGSVFVHYLSPAESAYASFETGTVTYRIRTTDGAWVGRYELYVDAGTGGVVGFPGSLSVEYAIEERNEEAGLVLRMSGVGVNALNDDLGPTRTYLDRIGYQSGI